MENQNVAILMATYNGEKYIKEQIESILKQTYKNIKLFIRDDNSTDNTNNIVNEYEKRYPENIIIVKDDKKAKGVIKNFMFLLEYVYNKSDVDIFMFSDQDDFWLEDKVEKTVKEYNKIQNKKQPILIHTDLYVVDCDLNIISKSFIKYSNLNTKYNKFNNYLVQNNATGCTTLINRELARMVEYNMEKICMHDWYFALIASAFGQVVFINEPMIKYRQHENNVIGARKSDKSLKDIFRNLKGDKIKIKENENELLEQAKEFGKAYGEKLDSKNKEILNKFINIKKMNKFKRIRFIIKNKLYRHGFSRIIGEIMFF